jgi:hypothetical protein
MPRTTRRRRPARSLLPLVLALSAVTVTGCAATATGATAGDGTPTPSATATATATTAETVTGRGPTVVSGDDLVIPDTARSLVVDFECSGGGQYTLELGDAMMLGQGLPQGTCDGPQELSWPLVADTEPMLSITVPDDVEWTATPTFLPEEFATDATLEANCATFSETDSALMNADVGYTEYDAFGPDEWASRVDGAADTLAELEADAHPDIADAVADLRALVSAPDRTTGTALTDDARAAIGVVDRACNANHTPLILMGEFGG